MTTLAEGTTPFRDGETWYAVSQPAAPVPAAHLPLVVLHGGPGMTHDYLRALPNLFDDRQVVLYDQFGTGNSSHRPDWNPKEWTPALFVDQLSNLLTHLGFAETGGYHLLGHSWGGMLAEEFTFTRPAGQASLILSDTSSSSAAIVESITALMAPISAEVPDDEQAQRNLFFGRHVCRLDPTPDDLVRSYELVAQNPSVFAAMMGPTGDDTGTLHGWTAIPRLPEITVPTLVLAGEHDELQPVAWSPFAEYIPGVRTHVFAGASHVPYLEVPEEYRAVVGGFLAEHDGAA